METISIREAADRLGVSHKVIRRLIQQGALPARKAPGAHGAEWTLEAAALDAYRSGKPVPATPRHATNGPQPERDDADASYPARPPKAALPEHGGWSLVEALGADKRFLQDHVSSLTTLLHEALVNGPTLPLPSPIAAGQGEPESQSASPGDGSGSAVVFPPGADSLPGESVGIAHVTDALQSSLRIIGTDAVRAVEMCSVKVLWGKPVLWRVVAEHEDAVSALVDAILSPDAAWDPPGEEVLFLWARDAAGEVIWGAACGSDWFGPPFQDALRTARVERR